MDDSNGKWIVVHPGPAKEKFEYEIQKSQEKKAEKQSQRQVLSFVQKKFGSVEENDQQRPGVKQDDRNVFFCV